MLEEEEELLEEDLVDDETLEDLLLAPDKVDDDLLSLSSGSVCKIPKSVYASEDRS